MLPKLLETKHDLGTRFSVVLILKKFLKSIHSQRKSKMEPKTTRKKCRLLQNTVHQQLCYKICTKNEIKRIKQLKLRVAICKSLQNSFSLYARTANIKKKMGGRWKDTWKCFGVNCSGGGTSRRILEDWHLSSVCFRVLGRFDSIKDSMKFDIIT